MDDKNDNTLNDRSQKDNDHNQKHEDNKPVVIKTQHIPPEIPEGVDNRLHAFLPWTSIGKIFKST